MIFVNDLLSSYGVTRNILNHFKFTIWDAQNDDWIIIDHASADDYVYLCDREVDSWVISDEDDKKIEIFLTMEDQDHYHFKNARKYV